MQHKSRIELSDNAMTVLSKMADGNMGAVNVLMLMMKEGAKIDPDSALGGLGAVLSLDSHGIYGSDIYVLHNDICNNKLPMTLAVLRGVQLGFLSGEVLKDACSRQDRSGKKMIPVDELYKQVTEKLPNFDN